MVCLVQLVVVYLCETMVLVEHCLANLLYRHYLESVPSLTSACFCWRRLRSRITGDLRPSKISTGLRSNSLNQIKLLNWPLHVKHKTIGERQTGCFFTSVAEELNSGPAGKQLHPSVRAGLESWTYVFQVPSPNHSASCCLHTTAQPHESTVFRGSCSSIHTSVYLKTRQYHPKFL